MADGPMVAEDLVEGAEVAEDTFTEVMADGLIDPHEEERMRLVLRSNVTATDRHCRELVCIVTEIRRGIFSVSAERQRTAMRRERGIVVIEERADELPPAA